MGSKKIIEYLGFALSMVGIASLSENVLEWKDFFVYHILDEYRLIRDVLFSVFPFNIPDGFKDYLIASSLATVPLALERKNKIGFRFDHLPEDLSDVKEVLETPPLWARLLEPVFYIFIIFTWPFLLVAQLANSFTTHIPLSSDQIKNVESFQDTQIRIFRELKTWENNYKNYHGIYYDIIFKMDRGILEYLREGERLHNKIAEEKETPEFWRGFFIYCGIFVVFVFLFMDFRKTFM